MDIHCSHCGEPWEHDMLHDIDGATYKQAVELFIQYGCGAFDLDQPKLCRHEPIYDGEMLSLIRASQDMSPYPDEWSGPDEIEFMLELL